MEHVPDTSRTDTTSAQSSERTVDCEEDTVESDFLFELNEEVDKILRDMEDWQVGEYVAVRYDNSWYPGVITNVVQGTYVVSCMEYLNKVELTNKFRWPSRKDENKYELDDLLLKLDKPILQGKRNYYTLVEDDFSDACDLLQMDLK